MKRLSAILLVAVLLFNFYGYRWMISYMESRHEVVFEGKLDREQYNDDELITIKTVLNLPYYYSSETFERTYGSVEVNGVTYEYVKRRVYRDTLELLCIPNKTKMQLQSAKVEFFKRSVESTPQEKKSTTLKVSLPDFFQDNKAFSLALLSLHASQYFTQDASRANSGYSWINEQPPESMPSHT